MCVTSGPTIITGTETYVYSTMDNNGNPVHVCGYQNTAKSFSTEGPDCMFLNFAGRGLRMVRGPEHTFNMMADITSELEELVYVPRSRGSFGSPSRGVSVEEYGDYTVVLSQEPGDILGALNRVRADRRPVATDRLKGIVNFYMSFYRDHSFALACFNGNAKPKHPIVVGYQPLNYRLMTIPGLDGHDGRPPTIGAPVYRGFKVAFGIEGVRLEHPVRYRDAIATGAYWAPDSVVGFVDNRTNGINGDYIVPVEAVHKGLTGADLADRLISPLG